MRTRWFVADLTLFLPQNLFSLAFLLGHTVSYYIRHIRQHSFRRIQAVQFLQETFHFR